MFGDNNNCKDVAMRRTGRPRCTRLKMKEMKGEAQHWDMGNVT